MSCTLLYVCAGFLGDISEEITFPAWHTGNQGHFFFEKKKRKMQTTNYYIYQNKFKYICIPIKKYLCVGQADSAKYFQNFNHKELFKCLMYKRNGIHKFSMKRNYNNIVYLLYFLNLF